MKKSNILFLFAGIILGFIFGNICTKKSCTKIDEDLENELNSYNNCNIEGTSCQIFDIVKKISNSFNLGRKSIEDENAN